MTTATTALQHSRNKNRDDDLIPHSVIETFTCALYDNKSTLVRKLLRDYPRLVQHQVFFDQYPFDFVTSTGRLEMAQILLEFGAQVNRRGRHLNSPMMNAVTDRDMKMVRLLLQHGAGVNSPDMDGRTPLFEAVAWNNPAVVRLLLDHGALINHRDQSGRTTPLMFAVLNRRIRAVPVLLEHPDVDLLCENEHGMTALHISCADNPSGWRLEPFRVEVVRVLLEHPRTQVDYVGSTATTALEQCVKRDYMEYVKLFLQHGANPLRTEGPGKSALAIACQDRNLDMIYEIVRFAPHLCIRRS